MAAGGTAAVLPHFTACRCMPTTPPSKPAVLPPPLAQGRLWADRVVRPYRIQQNREHGRTESSAPYRCTAETGQIAPSAPGAFSARAVRFFVPLSSLKLLLQLLSCQHRTDRPPMRAVFQILARKHLAHQRVALPRKRMIARLDGGLAGDGM